jgi:glucose/arabinose dehydrogenase
MAMQRLLATVLMGLSLTSAAVAQHIAFPVLPIPKVTQSAVAIELTDFVQVPPSGNNSSAARINFLFHAGDNSGRLFVNDMRGKIYVIRNGKVSSTPFLDISAVRAPYFVAGGGSNSEVGVLSFAFHPNFGRKGTPGYGKFYTLHSETRTLPDDGHVPVFAGPKSPPDHFNVLSEWSVDSSNPDRIAPESRREILRLAAHSDDHGGGLVAFNPNALAPTDGDYGLLYVSVGDGGNTVWDGGKVEEFHLAQNMMSAFGKILRINPLASNAKPYAIPGTNPFAGRKDTLPEIWASGLRNPQRFSWDAGGQRKMLIADIGQASVEEINLGKAGANYGWGLYEGEFAVDHQNEKNLTPIPGEKLPPNFQFPVATYGHADGQAVTGGFVYRGKAIPELSGKYIFGDLANGALFFADAQSLEAGRKTPVLKLNLFYHGLETTMAGILKNPRADLRLGLGGDGEIYVLTKTDGAIRRIAPHRK